MQIAPTKKDRNKKTTALYGFVNYTFKLVRRSLLLSLTIEQHNHGNHFIYRQKHKGHPYNQKAAHFTLI